MVLHPSMTCYFGVFKLGLWRLPPAIFVPNLTDIFLPSLYGIFLGPGFPGQTLLGQIPNSLFGLPGSPYHRHRRLVCRLACDFHIHLSMITETGFLSEP